MNGLPADGSVVSWPSTRTPTGTHAAAGHARARGTIIIPAHDEAGVIARTLTALTELTRLPALEVIVVCNACSDATAAIARGFAGVEVVEIAEGSKPAAMNAGDATAGEWPRLYLDADIDIAPQAVLAVFDALADPKLLAARPSYVYDVAGASAVVRGYYRARSRATAPQDRLWGAGGYAVSAAGHARFGSFPRVTADDSWFDAQFAGEEKAVITTEPMRVRTPRRVADLLAVLTRQRRGYLELKITSEAGSRGRALLRSIRTPRDVFDVACYAVLTMVSRRRASRVLRAAGVRAWERDASSRADEGGAR